MVVDKNIKAVLGGRAGETRDTGN